MPQNYTFKESFTADSIRFGGYLQTTSEYTDLDKCHGSRAFIHVVRGCVSLRSDATGSNHVLQSGDTLFLSPSVSYKIKDFIDTNKGAHQIGFVFVLAFDCSSPLIESFNERLFFTRQDERHYLSSLSAELERTFDFSHVPEVRIQKDASFGGDQIIKNYLELFLISCYRRENPDELASREAHSDISPRKEDICSQIIEYIRGHLTEKITLGDIADSMNLSVSMIERSFKEYTGNSVVNYISQLRIDTAKQMISEGGHSFTEITELVGFDNVHYFSNRFRKFTGMTPTQYANSLTTEHFVKKECVIPYAKDPDWSRVPFIHLEDLHWGNMSNIETDYQAVWNEDAIMLHADIKESRIAARYDKPNQPIYFDSYTEIFIQPVDGQSRYMNIGINPNGAIYCGISEYSHDRIRVLMDPENESPYYKTNTIRKAGGWEAFWIIPVGLIQLFYSDYSLNEGAHLYGNFCKCFTDGLSTHYLSWTPLPAYSRSFHRPEAFGIITLGPKNAG